MDTELLRTFLELRNTRHFGRAADNLFITQAAVSARIKQLEESLGVSLFTRSRNNIQLTGEGERLVPHAETVLQALVRARQEMVLEDAGGSQLFLGVRVGIWSAALQRRLDRLGRREPELVLRVESHEPGQLVDRLLGHNIDLAILYEPPSLPELDCVPVGELSLRLFSAASRDTVEQALAGNYVYMDWGGGFHRFHQRHFGERRVPALRTNIRELVRDHLGNRGGACYLPWGQRSQLREQGLTPVRGAPEFKRRLNMVYHRGGAQRELVETAVDVFRDVTL